jgi:hypothetical protein
MYTVISFFCERDCEQRLLTQCDQGADGVTGKRS